MLGALVRVGLAEAAPHGPGAWPWATFAVNMAGALLLGYFFALLRDHPEESLAHPFLTTGICGTLTTFSTLQLELFEMVDGGHLGLAAAYVGATLAAGFLFVRARDRARAPRPTVSRTRERRGLDRGRPARRRRRRRPLPDRRRLRRAHRPPLPARHPRGQPRRHAGARPRRRRGAATARRWSIVAGGGIGSFTTFSTWMLDSHRLADAGHAHLAWLNLGLSLVAGFAAVALGHWLGGVL